MIEHIDELDALLLDIGTLLDEALDKPVTEEQESSLAWRKTRIARRLVDLARDQLDGIALLNFTAKH